MSCRRGTPRNDCGCCKSLAEKVRELYQRCANAIKSINGINPDGANNFDILPGAGIQVNPRANGIEIVATGAAPQDVVKSVNGTTPDADGDVQINTGLLTVNTIAPDADGKFSITAGSGIQINAGTNGIEIENISQGAIYTGVSPIEINASNEISLKPWSFIPKNTWATLISSYRIVEDIIIVFGYGNTLAASRYYPKNYFASTTNSIRGMINATDTMVLNTNEIFNNNNNVYGSLSKTGIQYDYGQAALRIDENTTSSITVKKSDTDIPTSSSEYWIAILKRS